MPYTITRENPAVDAMAVQEAINHLLARDKVSGALVNQLRELRDSIEERVEPDVEEPTEFGSVVRAGIDGLSDPGRGREGAQRPGGRSVTTALCDNANHPSGAWHEATPLPFSWQWGRRIHQWLNRERWGCRCSKGSGGEEDGAAARVGLVSKPVTDEGQQVLGTCSPERFPNLKAAWQHFLHPEPWDPPAKDETTPTVIAAWIGRHRHRPACDGTDNCGCAS